MSRIDHYNDPDAPRPTTVLPAASAVVVDDRGRLLLALRRDNSLWTIPGGAMEPGESIIDTAVREVEEETGIRIEVTRLVGVYSNPHHVVQYADGEIRQQFSICFAARPVSGTPTPSRETSDVQYFDPADIGKLDMHPSIHLRIDHFLQHRPEPYIG